MSDQGKMRNHLCPCGSGRRFKYCHGRTTPTANVHSMVLGGFVVLSIVLFIAYLKKDASSTAVATGNITGITQYSVIPGLDLEALDSSKQRQLVGNRNRTPCICDCNMTVAECRNIDPKCPHSEQLAQAALDALATGASEVSALPTVSTH